MENIKSINLHYQMEDHLDVGMSIYKQFVLELKIEKNVGTL